MKLSPFSKNLTCANYGIYAVTCVICHEQYVGQTMNKFSMRWASHHSSWNKVDSKGDKDQIVFLPHYSKSHGTVNKSL